MNIKYQKRLNRTLELRAVSFRVSIGISLVNAQKHLNHLAQATIYAAYDCTPPDLFTSAWRTAFADTRRAFPRGVVPVQWLVPYHGRSRSQFAIIPNLRDPRFRFDRTNFAQILFVLHDRTRTYARREIDYSPVAWKPALPDLVFVTGAEQARWVSAGGKLSAWKTLSKFIGHM